MPAPPADVRLRLPLGRWVVRGLTLALALAAAGYAWSVLAGPNFHTVVPGLVYRCAQPSADRLESLVRQRGIRTVINLRGCCDPLPWFLEEYRVANRLNVSQEDLSFSATRLPSVPTLLQLIDILDHTDYPVLFHCHKGADRTGMASAIALLLKTETPLEEARAQLSPRYGHLPLGKTGNIDRFFDLYSEWLAARGLAHSPGVFRRWAREEYCPAECRCAIEILWPREEPTRVKMARLFAFRIRCRNTSVKPWHLRPGSNAGIHASFQVRDQDGHRVFYDGRAGLFEATVAPGEHLDLTLAVPAPLLPGRYQLWVDMVDEQHAYFMQEGVEPLVRNLEVVP
jgi:protein tyrosine phosphatase (PTP) superfamily phosphohydrolase (DUF442 family)